MNRKNDKICIVSEFPPAIGGISRQAHLIGKAIKKEGFRFYPVSIHFPFPKCIKYLDNVRMLRTIVRYIILIPKFIINISKSEIVHIMSCSYLNFYLYTMVPAIIAKLLNRRLIIAYHGGECEAFLKRDGKIVKLILELAEQITVPSQYLKHVFDEFCIDTVIVRNFIETEKIKFISRKSIKPKFIFARHLSKEYGYHVVIKSFSIIITHFPEATLLLAGGGKDQKDAVKLVSDLGLAKHVKFLGYISNDQLMKHFEENDIFLNGSYVDNLPVSILEAFASGLPVISTKAGGIPCIVIHEHTGLLVELGDYTAMAASAIGLLNNPELANCIITNARAELKKYSKEIVIEEILKIYFPTIF